MLAAALGLAFLYEALSTTPVHDMPAICLLAVFLWLWIIAAVGIKRLHDRDRPGYLIAAPIVLGAIIAVVIAAVYQSAAAILPGAGAVALLALVPLGFLKGTHGGPNRYGPDPLAAKDPGAAGILVLGVATIPLVRKVAFFASFWASPTFSPSSSLSRCCSTSCLRRK